MGRDYKATFCYSFVLVCVLLSHPVKISKFILLKYSCFTVLS